ncbi:MAG TPA: sugar phosphate isomerase/epimerase family protein [Dermatophilaceae bacterium]|nr:sugar phosphate isomerase/epimerase family protein [Dermatophilaceae bacterium]
MGRLGAHGLTVSALTLGTELAFERRLQVAAAAGFTGVGIRAQDYLAARRDGWDDDAMQEALDGHGLAITEVELLASWAAGADSTQPDPEEAVLHVARTFHADHVNAGQFQPRPVEEVVQRFAALCDRAPDLRIALEFMPFGGLPDLASAWEVVRRAERGNAGLLVDAWHWARAAMGPADLAAVPAEQIIAIQLGDVGEQAMADLRQETLHHRLPPGTGFGDVRGLVQLLQGAGVDAPVSVEVMSDELLSHGPDHAAATVMAAARAVLR